MSDTELLAERDVCLGQHCVPKPEPQLHSVWRHDFPSDDRNGRLPGRKPSARSAARRCSWLRRALLLAASTAKIWYRYLAEG